MSRFRSVASIVAVTLTAATNHSFTPRNKAFFADEKLVSFVRPGLTITIQSAQIASDRTISTVFTTADPMGVPLDSEGIATPGAISTSFIAAYIPANQTQYVAYTTRSASGAVVASTQQASSDSGGTMPGSRTASTGTPSPPRLGQVSRQL